MPQKNKNKSKMDEVLVPEVDCANFTRLHRARTTLPILTMLITIPVVGQMTIDS